MINEIKFNKQSNLCKFEYFLLRALYYLIMGQEMSKPSSTTAINGSEQTYSTQEPSHPASALSSQKTSADVMDKFGANAGLAISMALNNNRRAISSDQSNKENSSCAIGILKVNKRNTHDLI